MQRTAAAQAPRMSGHAGIRLLVTVFVASLVVVLAGCAGTQAATTDANNDASLELVSEGKLTIVSDFSNPPFDYYKDGSTPAGFEVELLQELAEQMGLEANFLPAQKFDSIIPMIKQGGKADVGASNFTITDERAQEIDFTDAFIDSNQGIVTSASAADAVEADYKAALNVPSARIAVQAGTTGESWARENLTSATIVPLDSPIESLMGVEAGKFSAAIADLPVMQYEVLNSYTSLKVAMQVATGEQYGIVVSKDNPRLTSAINKALGELRANGTMNSLEVKWFGTAENTESAPVAGGAAASGSTDLGSIAVNKVTARPNESTGSGVIGGEETRLTWEGTVNVPAGISSVTLTLPDDATFDGSTTRITVLDGLNRLNINGEAMPSGNSIVVKFSSPVSDGSLLRLEITGMKFPSAGGEYTVGGSYTTASGATASLDASSPISIVENTPVQKIVTWLDGQEWVSAWNSVPFLGMFFKPQLLVTSFVSLFPGWLLCLLIVIVAYPFAIILGLIFALMRISKHAVPRGIASVYINLIRGTPQFLQIYIAFFGLPMLGITLDNVILGIIVVAINSSAYQAEVYRAGIQSIPQGQYEAAESLGMSHMQTMIWVILPQTVRRVIPTVTSDFITSYKDTSLLSSVGVMELMMFSKNLTSVSGNITPYIAAAIYYLIVTLPLIKVVGIVEKRMSDAEHGVGPRPKAGKPDSAAPSRGADDDAQSNDEKPSTLDILMAPFKPNRINGGVGDAI